MMRGLAKYIQVLKITFQEYFVYRLNFLLWRFRAVAQILALYFLWQAAIPEGRTVFGYDQAKILTYILGTFILRSLILASRSVDVAGQIATGDFSNFLIKPISYFKYWFVKDIGDKALNFFFAIFEISLIFWAVSPPFILQTNPTFLVFTVLAVLLGIVLYFHLSFLLSMMAFWAPENPWSVRFLFDIFIGFFAGGLFPLDILPQGLFTAFKFLPSTYLLFFPLDIYLGKLSLGGILTGLIIAFVWLVIAYYAAHFVFRKGVRNYAAWGR